MWTYTRTILTGLTALALVAFATGCGSDSTDGDAAGGDPSTDGSGSSGGAPPEGVDGRNWLSSGVTVGDEAKPLAPGSRIMVTFTDGEVHASAGCNSLFGTASWDGSVVTVSDVGGTEMGCSPDLMAQDEWLTGVLTSALTVNVDGDTMTMRAGDTVVSFIDREVAQPDVQLERTTWVLDGIGKGTPSEGTMSSVPGEVQSTLRIEGRQLSLRPGCNTGGGEVEVTEDTIVVGTVMITQKACPGARGQVEKSVLTVLQGEVSYSIDAGMLTLTNGQDILVYRANAAR